LRRLRQNGGGPASRYARSVLQLACMPLGARASKCAHAHARGDLVTLDDHTRLDVSLRVHVRTHACMHVCAPQLKLELLSSRWKRLRQTSIVSSWISMQLQLQIPRPLRRRRAALLPAMARSGPGPGRFRISRAPGSAAAAGVVRVRSARAQAICMANQATYNNDVHVLLYSARERKPSSRTAAAATAVAADSQQSLPAGSRVDPRDVRAIQRRRRGRALVARR
jgi:hypothetical protein